MNWSVELLDFAQRDLRSLTDIQRAAVYRAFRELEQAPAPHRIRGVVRFGGRLRNLCVLRTDHVRVYYELRPDERRLVVHRIVAPDARSH